MVPNKNGLIKKKSQENKFVYNFPKGNNKNSFICVSINVNFLKTETPQESTNISNYEIINSFTND